MKNSDEINLRSNLKPDKCNFSTIKFISVDGKELSSEFTLEVVQ